MRSKEDAHDYRYFPDPDLVPLVVSEDRVRELAKTLPELPAARRERFARTLGLSADAADVLIATRAVADYYEAVVAAGAEARLAANWVMGEILRMVKELKTGPGELRITPARCAAVLRHIASGAISAQAAKRTMETVQEQDRDPDAIIKELGLVQISDAGTLEAAVRQVVEANPREVERYRAGEKKLAGFFIGQAMKATAGKGNPKEISAIVARMLS